MLSAMRSKLSSAARLAGGGIVAILLAVQAFAFPVTV